MPSSLSRTAEALVLAGCTALFVCRVVIASAIVPPWQGPDEPTHFTLAYVLTMPSSVGVDAIQPQVMRSMLKYRWWELYGRPAPAPGWTSFDQVEGVGTGTFAQPLYYGLGSLWLRVTGAADLEGAYYRLRWLSVALSGATLACAWAGTRLFFGPEVAMGATAIAVLHPQFLLTAITVNPDALLYVWGAFVWWQTARLLAGHRRMMSLVLIMVGAAAAVMTKRMGLALVGIAALGGMSMVAMEPRILKRRGTLVAAGATIILAGVVVIVVLRPLRDEGGQLNAVLSHWIDAVTIRRNPDPSTILRYLQLSIDYLWLAGGWSQFVPPTTWLWAARLFILASFAGAALATVAPSPLRPRFSIAWTFVGVQAVAVVGATLWTVRSAPNGRYFLSVLAPGAALLYLGFARLVPARYRDFSPFLLIAILAILDVTGFTTVLVPAYLQ